jgi:serine/threonine protein kinase
MTRPVSTPGRLVAGRYRLQSQLGGGGMGTVWLARDELLGRQVAIKQVLTASGISAQESDQQRQRALREGRIAARLSHPHAISVYDVAVEAGQPWLVMEYLPSRSLAQVLSEDGVLRVDQVAQIGAQVADALAATHAAGIVHRDVKPANVLIGEGGRVEGLVKITDFGISHASGDITLTQTGQITGTPAFLAPEVAQGHPMTEASDVFSLGALLYTCIEGQPPFGMEDNALAMLHKVAGGQIMPPRRTGSLTEPLLRMLAADPGDRPQMPEIRDALAKLAAGSDGDTTTVLLARTDVGSGSAGRDRTSTFSRADAAVTPVPPRAASSPPTRTDIREPGPADRPAAPPPVAAGRERTGADPAPPREPGRRRGRALWVLAGLVAAVLAGLIVFWAVALDDDPGDAGATGSPTTTAETTTGSDEPSDRESSPTTEESSPSPSPSSSESASESESGSEAPAAGDPAEAVTGFFSLLPDDLSAAHELTSPDFQAEFPLERFSGFWDDFADVQVDDVEAVDDTTALVDITYVRPDGSSTTERHELTFIQREDGRLLLDTDTRV